MRLQTLTALAAASTLGACAPLWAKPDLTVAPQKCIVEASAAVPEAPRVPDGAAIPAPVTQAEKDGTGAYLEWLAAFGADSREKTRRLTAIKRWCDSR